ncbi:hypothetical protein AArc1_1527 [Natrarchaeobaculum sulfurireducens]|uniref:Uncharacterized protein n=1 Tax=Natrarchaeobaculum sulfurireducens TaxID=2044521 RepID=A0A346PEB5_9EURY|nr:hypothetical protein AArc1_1527 [Natrarchaeobaculum sulfurireducens]
MVRRVFTGEFTLERRVTRLVRRVFTGEFTLERRFSDRQSPLPSTPFSRDFFLTLWHSPLETRFRER